MIWLNKFFINLRKFLMSILTINIKKELKGLSKDEVIDAEVLKNVGFNDDEIIASLKIGRFNNKKNALILLLKDHGFSEGEIHDFLAEFLPKLKAGAKVSEVFQQVITKYSPK